MIMKLPSEVRWFNELSELVENYDISSFFCCESGLLRKDGDGFVCGGSYGCGHSYEIHELTRNMCKEQVATCTDCKLENLFPLEEESFVCKKCRILHLMENHELASPCCDKGSITECENGDYICNRCGMEIDLEELWEEDLQKKITCSECTVEFNIDLDDDVDYCEGCAKI